MALGILCERERAKSLRRATATAAEDGDIGAVDQCVADGRLRGKRVDREDRIGVTVSDNREIGREDQGLDAPSVDHDAARLITGERQLFKPKSLFLYKAVAEKRQADCRFTLFCLQKKFYDKEILRQAR